MKKFLVIGNMNAVTYKEVFSLIKANKMWVGCNSKGGTRKGNSLSFDAENGVKDVSSWWFTNLGHNKRHKTLDLYKKYNPEEFPKYDNYDAIEVGKTCDIPMDYEGIMGVPISFLVKYCPEQFELIWTTDRGGDGMLEDLKVKDFNKSWNSPMINGKFVYKRILIKSK